MLLRVEAAKAGRVAARLEVELHLVPRGAAHVLDDHHRRPAARDPAHHAAPRLAALALLVDALLVVGEVRVVDARRAGDEQVARVARAVRAGHAHLRAVGRRRERLGELADVAEEHGRLEVALDVRLLVRLDLAREDVLDGQLRAERGRARLRDHLEREQQALGARAHRRDAQRPARERLGELLDRGRALHEVVEHLLRLVDHGQVGRVGLLLAQRERRLREHLEQRVLLHLHAQRLAAAVAVVVVPLVLLLVVVVVVVVLDRRFARGRAFWGGCLLRRSGRPLPLRRRRLLLVLVVVVVVVAAVVVVVVRLLDCLRRHLVVVLDELVKVLAAAVTDLDILRRGVALIFAVAAAALARGDLIVG